MHARGRIRLPLLASHSIVNDTIAGGSGLTDTMTLVSRGLDHVTTSFLVNDGSHASAHLAIGNTGHVSGHRDVALTIPEAPYGRALALGAQLGRLQLDQRGVRIDVRGVVLLLAQRHQDVRSVRTVRVLRSTDGATHLRVIARRELSVVRVSRPAEAGAV